MNIQMPPELWETLIEKKLGGVLNFSVRANFVFMCSEADRKIIGCKKESPSHKCNCVRIVVKRW